MNNPAPSFLETHKTIKQFVNLEEPHTGCYRIWAEDGTGAATQAGEICWPGYGDTGMETGLDTGLDTGSGKDSAQDTSSPDTDKTPPKESCTCSTKASAQSAWLWGLILLVFIRPRPERSGPHPQSTRSGH
jgi:hypothetical protein